MSSSNSCLCARTKWRLCPHQKLAVPGFCRAPPDNEWSCFLRRSTPTLRRRLILSADFERCVDHIFRLIVYIFFLPLYVTSSGFELRLNFFVCFIVYRFFFMFSQFFIFFGLPNTVSLRSHYCAWGRAIKRPRTKSTAVRQVSNVHERDLVTNQNA